MPARTIWPILEDEGKAHALRRLQLVDVLQTMQTTGQGGVKTLLRAVDGYAAAMTVTQARARRSMVATRLDAQAMALRGLGPLLAIHDAGRIAAMAALSLAKRCASCPWALHHISVKAD